MLLEGKSTVFDVLAFLYSLLTKEEERECAIQWSTAMQRHVRAVLEKYRQFIEVIRQSAMREYRFTESDLLYLNNELKQLQQHKKGRESDIYLLAIEVEHSIEKYSEWQNNGVMYQLSPLNTNAEETGISVYPRLHPQWNQAKSERGREYVLNSSFQNFLVLRNSDMAPFEIVMHYWHDTGLLKKKDDGWVMSVALVPVMDYAALKTESHDTVSGKAICVKGLENGDTVTGRVLQAFDELFPKQYSMVIFPEALGTEELVSAVKARMRIHPEYHTFVLLPTICENGRNTLVVLGPGGIDCLKHDKLTPFILIDKERIEQREELDYDRKIHLLITEELGTVAFAICAELLDPAFYETVTRVGRADTIICPSFSPGVTAFKETIMKGTALKLLQFYINTCSAKTVSRKGVVPEDLAMVQTPFSEEEMSLKSFQRACAGKCADTVCYFELTISYVNETFIVEGVHKCA